MANKMKAVVEVLETIEIGLNGVSDAIGEIPCETPFTCQDATSITNSLEGISMFFNSHEISSMTESLESIAKSLAGLIQIKKQTQRNRSNGLNFSPSPKHSKYLKRRIMTTADGRKTRGKVTFSRTGKRLFIQNNNGYTSE